MQIGTYPKIYISFCQSWWQATWVTHNVPHFFLSLLIASNIYRIIVNFLTV